MKPTPLNAHYQSTLNSRKTHTPLMQTLYNKHANGADCPPCMMLPFPRFLRALSVLFILGSTFALQNRASASTAHPNEPAGFTRFAEHACTAIPPSDPGLIGNWWAVSTSSLTTINDSSAPSSPLGTIRTRYIDGLSSGSAPVNWGGWDSAGKGAAGQKRKLYFSMWIKIEGTDYENQGVGTKAGFIAYAEPTSGAANQGFLMIQGVGSQSIGTAWNVRFNQQNNVSRNMSQNVNTSKLMTVGSWHHWECLHELNTLGQANGIFKMWIDGIQTHSYSDVTYITEGNTNGFYGYKWNPTWGGIGGTKTRTDYIRQDHIYMSGVPMSGGAPAAPSGLSATAISSSQINLAWTDNSGNETGFKIDRKTSATGTYSQIATTGSNVTSYNNTGLAASTTYYYRVRATNASGDSAYSNEANATTQAGSSGGIAFRAASSGGTGTGGGVTSATLNKPAGVVSGDVMLAAINLGASATVTPPAGWTLVRTIDDTIQMKIYRKTAGSSEPTSYTWTLSAARRFAGGIVAFSGVNATTPIQVENGAAHTTTASTSHTTPSITTSGSGTWLVSVFGDQTTGGSTWTPPSGTTERADVRNTSGTSYDQSLEINTVGPVAAGSKTHTAVASKSSAKAGMAIIALQP